MKTRQSKLIQGIFILCIFLFVTGCSKSTINIYDGEEESGTSGQANKGQTLVTFNASIESRNVTRAMSPMKSGIKSHIYAYMSPASTTTQETLTAQGIYVTSSPGVLSGADGYKMYLPNGIYNFYSVSDNFSTFPPTFSNGESEPLFNGIDYLWWKSAQQDVTSSQINIPIVFQHACTQVVINVAGGNGVTLNKLVSATIAPPTPGATMNIFTGIIPSATTYGRPDKMGIKGLTAQYIMLPLKTDTPMQLALELNINNETDSRIFTAGIPLPDGELKAGDSYVFSAIVDGNTVSFPQVSVKDWTEVDETGNPLYPSQK